MESKIIIVGAGIAGVSLAVLLTQKGIPCIVLESRDHFGAATSGVRISSKGVRVLHKMGLSQLGENSERLIMHFGKKKVDFTVQRNPAEPPAIIVTRLAIFEKLREQVESLGIEVRYNFNLIHVTEETNRVIAVAEDGRQVEGKYLVGADGVGSKVRCLLNRGLQAEKRYAGYLGIGLIFPSEIKEEMSLYTHVNENVGLGSIGKISDVHPYKSNFLWLHIHMSEQEAKTISDEEVQAQLVERAKKWPPYLHNVYREAVADSRSILYHQPVYNGSVPERWYSERLFLIGDAAHPYGPGGQGISLAMLDAEALSELLGDQPTEEQKANFQRTRAAEAKAKGESAEDRNKPKNQITSPLKLMVKGIMMQGYRLFKGGKIALL
jgi:salicylate hydroxylase